ncbi:hypothetical protein ACQ4PT_056487 [Festuca glaucescens]
MAWRARSDSSASASHTGTPPPPMATAASPSPSTSPSASPLPEPPPAFRRRETPRVDWDRLGAQGQLGLRLIRKFGDIEPGSYW